ncbi:MAG: hypothetical protein ABI346_05250, partial [Candidatus Baltobacteraceae bacterium]
MLVLLAAAFMSLGLLDLDVSRGWWRRTRVRLAIGVPLVLLYAYAEMPALVFPQALTLLLYTLIPSAAFALMDAARVAVVSRRIVSVARRSVLGYLAALVLLLGFA